MAKPSGLAAALTKIDQEFGEVIMARRAAFSATSAVPILLGLLPIGSIVIDVLSFGGATGVGPTVHVGTLADADAFASDLAAGTVAGAISTAQTGASINAVLTSATEVYGKVGTVPATGGTVGVAILYTTPR